MKGDCNNCKCSHCANEGRKCCGCFDCMWMPEDGCEHYLEYKGWDWECLKQNLAE